MQALLRRGAALAGVAAITAASSIASAAGPISFFDIALDSGLPSGATAPWVNLRFIDLGFVAGSAFDGVKNWVELQVTTTQTLEPPPFNASQLATFGLSPYPTVGQVVGLGNLPSPGSVTSVSFGLDTSAVAGFDPTKLALLWTGSAGFPHPGANFDSFSLSGNTATINFASGALGPDGAISSKLAFTYDGGGTDIGLDLFGAPIGGGALSRVAPVVGKATLAGTGNVNEITGSSVVFGSTAPIPEPSTYAMMGVGLLSLLGMSRRRRGMQATA
jgi:hypothetical protein